MKFVPDQSTNQKKVPYFEDAARSSGYGGYSTTKDKEKLKAEVSHAIANLGGQVLTFVGGKFVDETDGKRTRPGFSITYVQNNIGGRQLPGKIDFAGLPCRNPNNIIKSEKMVLWMVARAFEAMFYFEQMAPGFSTLMPFMIESKTGKTMYEFWNEQILALPAPQQDMDDVVDGEISS